MGEQAEHRDGATAITVRREGTAVHVHASVALPVPPQSAFMLLTHPDNHEIFRHLEECTSHRVLHEQGARMRVEQDHSALTSRFSLLPGRLSPLSVFDGQWQVAPLHDTPGTLNGAGAVAAGSVVSLRQELRPSALLPPPLGGLLAQLACSQLHGIFGDLQAEAARVRAGRPTLSGM
eukprot:scaffold6.g2621.t1